MDSARRARTIRQILALPSHDSAGVLIVRGAVVSIAVRVCGLALSYGANVLLSRALGVEAFGEYVVALSWALVLALPAKVGFDNSALRYSSIYFDREDFAAWRGFVRVATIVIAAVSLAIALLILEFGSLWMPVSAGARAWTAALVPPLALLAFYSVLMRTARRVASAQFYEQMLRPGLIILGIAAAAFARFRLSPSSAMCLTTFAAAAALAGLIIHSTHIFRAAGEHPPRYAEWRQWLALSIPMLMMGAVQELTNQVDILLLGQLADQKQAAFFAASWRIASLVPFALVALATLSGPMVASAYARSDFREMHRISKLVSRSSLSVGIVAAAALWLLGGWLLSWFGPQFQSATVVLNVLLAGAVVNAFTGIVSYFMTMTGRERGALVIYVASLAISIALNLLLIPRFGAEGAAIASSSATIAWNLAMLVYVRATMGIDASALALPVRRDSR